MKSSSRKRFDEGRGGDSPKGKRDRRQRTVTAVAPRFRKGNALSELKVSTRVDTYLSPGQSPLTGLPTEIERGLLWYYLKLWLRFHDPSSAQLTEGFRSKSDGR